MSEDKWWAGVNFTDLGESDDCKVKLTSSAGETKWMNVSPEQVQQIRRILAGEMHPVLFSMRTIVNHVWPSVERDYQKQSGPGRSRRVFNDLQEVDAFLKENNM